MSRGVTVFIVAGIFGLAVLVGGAAGLLYLHVERHKLTTIGAPVGGRFELTASDGQKVSNVTYQGKWVLLYFGYTRCPDVCPVTLARIGRVLNALGPEANKLRALFISIDPRHDNPKVMAQYLKAFDKRIIGLTGTAKQIARVVREFKIYLGRQKNGQVDIAEHGGYLYLLNRRGKFLNVIDGDLSRRQIVKDLRRKMGQATS